MCTPANPVQKKEDLLRGWHQGLRILQKGNFAASTYYRKIGKRFGVPVVISTSVVSSAVFGTVGQSEYWGVQLAAGFVSILTTVLSSLQTFLGYFERSASHKEAAAGYGELRTELQVLLAGELSSVPDLDERIESIRTQWTALDKGSPTLPKWIYDEAARDVGNDAPGRYR